MLALRLLRGNVLGRAHHHAVLGDLCLVGRIAHAKIGDFHQTLVADHNISRLHIAVNDAMRMSQVKPASHLLNNRQQLESRDALALLVDVGQRARVQELHDEEAEVIVLVVLEKRSNIRMRQISRIMRLSTQTFEA